MRVVTCNIRTCGADDGENNWVHRREVSVQVIRSRAPDIICFQEMCDEQLWYLRPALPEFEWYGIVDEPVGRHPVNAVFYRRDGFERISAGGYWLSETPHVAGSRSWDSRCVRLANWVRLGERASGKEFRVINTHLDHVSQPARESQARLVNEDARAYPVTYPQVLTGDMNCDATNPALRSFLVAGWRDTYEAAHGPGDAAHTFHAFRGPAFQADLGRIDWVFVRGAGRVTGARVIRDCVEGRYPSDHYFVSADIEIE